MSNVAIQGMYGLDIYECTSSQSLITELEAEAVSGVSDAERATIENMAGLWNTLEGYRRKMYFEMETAGLQPLKEEEGSRCNYAEFAMLWTDVFYELLERGKTAEDIHWSYLKKVVLRHVQQARGISLGNSVSTRTRRRLRYLKQKYGDTLQFESEDQKQALLGGMNLKRLPTPMKDKYDKEKRKRHDAKSLPEGRGLQRIEGRGLQGIVESSSGEECPRLLGEETRDVTILLQPDGRKELRGLSVERNMTGRVYHDDDSGNYDKERIDTHIPKEHWDNFLQWVLDGSRLTNRKHRDLFLDAMDGINKAQLATQYDMGIKGIEKTLLRIKSNIREFAKHLPDWLRHQVYDMIVYLSESQQGVPIMPLKPEYMSYQEIGMLYKDF